MKTLKLFLVLSSPIMFLLFVAYFVQAPFDGKRLECTEHDSMCYWGDHTGPIGSYPCKQQKCKWIRDGRTK